MTPDEIKKTWAEASRRFYAPTPEEFETMYRERKETALEQLAQRYRRFSRLGLVMAVVSVFWMFSHISFAESYMKYVTSIVFILYFATCSIIDNWLYNGVKSIDCFTMSVSEVIDKALYYRRKHLQSMILLIPFAVVAMGTLAFSFVSEPYMIYGMIAGLIIGLAIGLQQFRSFMAEYRTISKT
ncbi:MAG: hypothetical protein K2O24_03055 [Muribaculaceae bacterium]|nr:hypothetical protein [Muribaculaceae bacterium]